MGVGVGLSAASNPSRAVAQRSRMLIFIRFAAQTLLTVVWAEKRMPLRAVAQAVVDA